MSTDVLQNLVKAEKFVWEEKHEMAFQKLKDDLSSDTILAYFDTQAQHEVHVDGWPFGVSATLVQKRKNDEVWRVVQYASRALNSGEKKYSQIELEMLAVDFGCKKFHVYLYGARECIPAAITRLDIIKSTAEDSILQKVIKCMKRWKDRLQGCGPYAI